MLRVQLGERSYPIFTGRGLLRGTGLISEQLEGRAAVIVSNETVAPLYLSQLETALGGAVHASVVLPDGERYKTLDTLNTVYTTLLERRCDRSAVLLALGGGVVGDITGFAAASYLRGVDYIQLPTTLLAQVDSAVGGKTGVNHALGKNMIGAFHQPRAVIIDSDTLNTLDDRQMSAGAAEIIKYGLIGDPELFDWLENHIEALLAREPEALIFAIRRACENKARLVIADEREQTGERALLNLGHTFGHAIETGLGYGDWLHGEAVGCGMMMAARLSRHLGWLRAPDVERIGALLRRARLPLAPPPTMTPERFLELMAIDKKTVGGRLRLVLLKAIGRAVVTADFDPAALKAVLAEPTAA